MSAPLSGPGFPAWLRAARQRRDWTQSDLAVQANCTVVSVRRFEQGRGRPSKRHMDQVELVGQTKQLAA